MKDELEARANILRESAVSPSFVNDQYDATSPPQTHTSTKKTEAIDNNDVPEIEEEEKKPVIVEFGEVSRAAFRIRKGVKKTPLHRASESLIEECKCELYFKKDFLLPTGSFKERGARNALMLMSDKEKANGAIAASAGNHALALAYHGKNLGIDITVVMPVNAPLMKVNRCRGYGANIILHGDHIGDAKDRATEISIEKNMRYINGYDDPAIIAGAGTMGMEILEDLQDIDAIVIPVGGAGLLAGLAVSIKTLNPEIQIYAVEPERAASYTASYEAGKVVTANVLPTLGDGLAVPTVGTNAFYTSRPHIHKIVQVKESQLARTLLKLVECEKIVVEGGGAAGLAAIMSGLLPELEGKTVVTPLCGSNIDTTVLGRCFDRGLAADGRLVRFVATVADRPGGVATLAAVLAEVGVSIKDIYHERAWLNSNIFAVQVRCVVETSDWTHAEKLRTRLESDGYDFNWGPHSPDL